MRGIELLVFLVHTKNDINRRRRRFHYYKSVKRVYDSKTCKYKRDPKYKAKHIPVNYAKRAYRKAQADAKAMTKDIRALRTELGAHLVWGESGNVTAIRFKANSNIGYKTIHAREFMRWVDMYHVDMILLGGSDE